MATVSPSAVAVPTASTRVRVPIWAWVLLALAVFTLYLLSQENGALLGTPAAELLHELTHDARHALGVPCH